MEFEFTVRPATAMERQFLAREQIDSDLGSVLILAGREIVGWADDYGTVRVLPVIYTGAKIPNMTTVVDAAEEMLNKMLDLFEALDA